MNRFVRDTSGEVRDVVVVGVVALKLLARCGRRAADFFSRAGVRSPDKACRQDNRQRTPSSTSTTSWSRRSLR